MSKDNEMLERLEKLGIEVPTVFSFELQDSVPNMEGVQKILDLVESVNNGKVELSEKELELAIKIVGATGGDAIRIEVDTDYSLMFPGMYTVYVALRTANTDGTVVDYIDRVSDENYGEEDFDSGIVKAVRKVEELEQFIKGISDRQIWKVFHFDTVEELDKIRDKSMVEFAKYHGRA